MTSLAEFSSSLQQNYGLQINTNINNASSQFIQNFLTQPRQNRTILPQLTHQFVREVIVPIDLDEQDLVINSATTANTNNNNNNSTTAKLFLQLVDVIDVSKSISNRVIQKMSAFDYQHQQQQRNQNNNNNNNNNNQLAVPNNNPPSNEGRSLLILLASDGNRTSSSKPYRILSPYKPLSSFFANNSPPLRFGSKLLITLPASMIPRIQNNGNNNNNNKIQQHNNLILLDDTKNGNSRITIEVFDPLAVAINNNNYRLPPGVSLSSVQQLQQYVERRYRSLEQQMSGRSYWNQNGILDLDGSSSGGTHNDVTENNNNNNNSNAGQRRGREEETDEYNDNHNDQARRQYQNQNQQPQQQTANNNNNSNNNNNMMMMGNGNGNNINNMNNADDNSESNRDQYDNLTAEEIQQQAFQKPKATKWKPQKKESNNDASTSNNNSINNTNIASTTISASVSQENELLIPPLSKSQRYLEPENRSSYIGENNNDNKINNPSSIQSSDLLMSSQKIISTKRENILDTTVDDDEVLATSSYPVNANNNKSDSTTSDNNSSGDDFQDKDEDDDDSSNLSSLDFGIEFLPTSNTTMKVEKGNDTTDAEEKVEDTQYPSAQTNTVKEENRERRVVQSMKMQGKTNNNSNAHHRSATTLSSEGEGDVIVLSSGSDDDNEHDDDDQTDDKENFMKLVNTSNNNNNNNNNNVSMKKRERVTIRGKFKAIVAPVCIKRVHSSDHNNNNNTSSSSLASSSSSLSASFEQYLDEDKTINRYLGSGGFERLSSASAAPNSPSSPNSYSKNQQDFSFHGARLYMPLKFEVFAVLSGKRRSSSSSSGSDFEKRLREQNHVVLDAGHKWLRNVICTFVQEQNDSNKKSSVLITEKAIIDELFKLQSSMLGSHQQSGHQISNTLSLLLKRVQDAVLNASTKKSNDNNKKGVNNNNSECIDIVVEEIFEDEDFENEDDDFGQKIPQSSSFSVKREGGNYVHHQGRQKRYSAMLVKRMVPADANGRRLQGALVGELLQQQE